MDTSVSFTPPSRFGRSDCLRNGENGTLMLFRLLDLPGKLLRIEPIYDGSSSGSDPTQFLDRIELAREAIGRLRSFGVAVPDFAYVIAEGPREGRPALYTIVDEVLGDQLLADKPWAIERMRCFDDALARLVAYYRNAIVTGEPHWNDFNIGQFRYGTIYNDAQPRCYMIDVEPQVSRRISPEDLVGRRRAILTQLVSIAGGIVSVECVTASRGAFTETRAALLALIEDHLGECKQGPLTAHVISLLR